MARRPFIVVIGSINTDVILPTPRLPKPGETLAGGDVTVVAGGKGANQAVAAAYLEKEWPELDRHCRNRWALFVPFVSSVFHVPITAAAENGSPSTASIA